MYSTVLYCFVAVPSVRGVAAGLLHVLPEPAHLRRLHQEQGLPLLRLQAGDRGNLLPAAGPDVLPGEIPFSWKNYKWASVKMTLKFHFLWSTLF